jgi:uncharacterized protein
MPARVTHFEIYGEEPGKLADFYQAIFGWEPDKVPGIDYWRIQPESSDSAGLAGGITRRPNIEPRAWMNYVTVDSIDEVIHQVQSSGGQVIRPKAAVARTGWCAIAADPEGNLFALWQSDPSAMPMPEPD